MTMDLKNEERMLFVIGGMVAGSHMYGASITEAVVNGLVLVSVVCVVFLVRLAWYAGKVLNNA